MALNSIGDIFDNFSPGNYSRGSSARAGQYAGEAADVLRTLRQLALRYDTAYGPESELGQQLLSEAQITPEAIAGARGMAAADVERAYTEAKGAQERENQRLGIDPSSPAGTAGRRGMAVRHAANRAFTVNNAGRAERERRTNLGMALAGRGTAALSGLSSASSGLSGLTGIYQGSADTRFNQSPWWVPQISGQATKEFARGGLNPGRGMAHRGPPVEDPEVDTEVPMVRSPDGSFSPPETGVPGHVMGPGDEQSDSVPARLSKHEYVVPAFAVLYYGTDKLDKMVEKARVGMSGEEGEQEQGGGTPRRIAGQPPSGGGAGRGMAAAGGGVVHAPSGGFMNNLIDLKPGQRLGERINMPKADLPDIPWAELWQQAKDIAVRTGRSIAEVLSDLPMEMPGTRIERTMRGGSAHGGMVRAPGGDTMAPQPEPEIDLLDERKKYLTGPGRRGMMRGQARKHPFTASPKLLMLAAGA